MEKTLLNLKAIQKIESLAYVTLNLGKDYTIITDIGSDIKDLMKYSNELQSTTIPDDYRKCLIDIRLLNSIREKLDPKITLEVHQLTNSLFAAEMLIMVVNYVKVKERTEEYVEDYNEEEILLYN